MNRSFIYRSRLLAVYRSRLFTGWVASSRLYNRLAAPAHGRSSEYFLNSSLKLLLAAITRLQATKQVSELAVHHASTEAPPLTACWQSW